MAKAKIRTKSPSRKRVRQPYATDTYIGKEGIGALITRSKTFIWEAGDRALASYNITLSQWIVLETLFRGEELTPATLCRDIGYDPGAMTRLLDRLEKNGFVRRVRSTADRRSVHLELTKAGRALHPKLLAAIVGELNAILDGFTVTEARLLESLLNRVLVNARIRATQGRGEG